MLALALSLAVAAVEDPVVAQVRAKLADPAKPFTLAVTMTLKPDAAEAFATAAKAAAMATRKEPGCLTYEFSTSADDSAEVLLYERWASLDALVAHLQKPHTKALLAELPKLTTGGLKLVVRRPVGD